MISQTEMLSKIERYVEYEPNTGCWLWSGAPNAYGYGKTSSVGWPQGAHRSSWTAHKGPIPEGLHVLHRCDTPACVNPAHLFLGTHRDNIDDMVAKGRAGRPFLERCGAGHEIAGTNVYIAPGGRRYCRTCRAGYRRSAKEDQQTLTALEGGGE